MSVTTSLISKMPVVGPKLQRLIGDITAIRNELTALQSRTDGLAGEVGPLKEAIATIGAAQATGQAALEAGQAALQGALQADISRLESRLEERVGMLVHRLDADVERMSAGYDANTARVSQQDAELAELRSAVQWLHATLASFSPADAPASQPTGTEGVMADADSLFHELARQWNGVAGPAGSGPLHTLYLRLAREHSLAVRERAALQSRVDTLSKTLDYVRQDVGDRVVDSAETSTRLNVVFPGTVADAVGGLPVTVVDVGAQMLTSEDHVYAPLLAAGNCRVIGFEPLEDAADKRAAAEPGVTMLNHFIGKGGPASFQINHFDPTSSLLEPNLDYLRQFYALADMCRPVKRLQVETTRLDDIPEVDGCDYLKIDVQGGELDVLRGAERLLDTVLFVHTEVEFEPVYVNQPLFSDMDRFLRERGFELLDLTKLGHSGYAALPQQQSRTKLMWADAIYVKSTDRLSALGAPALLKAAYIAHANYKMYDFAAHLIGRFDQDTGSGLLDVYLAAVNG